MVALEVVFMACVDWTVMVIAVFVVIVLDNVCDCGSI